MQTGKVVPTSVVVDTVYDNMKKQDYNDLKNGIERKMYVAPKKDTKKRSCWKLNNHQVDMIRYLTSSGFKSFVIAEYFDVSRSVVVKIKNRESHFSHTSPFEIKVGTYKAEISEVAWLNWVKKHKISLDLFCKFYEERVNRDVFIAKR